MHFSLKRITILNIFFFYLRCIFKTKSDRKPSNFNFSGQKLWPARILLSILQSFLCLIKEIDTCIVSWNNTKRNFPWKLQETNFNVQRNSADRATISSSVSFHQYFQMQSQRNEILLVLGFCPPVSRTSSGFSVKV